MSRALDKRNVEIEEKTQKLKFELNNFFFIAFLNFIKFLGAFNHEF